MEQLHENIVIVIHMIVTESSFQTMDCSLAGFAKYIGLATNPIGIQLS